MLSCAFRGSGSVGPPSSLLKGGMTTRQAADTTVVIAEFVTRGVAAQRAGDVIIAAESLKRKS